LGNHHGKTTLQTHTNSGLLFLLAKKHKPEPAGTESSPNLGLFFLIDRRAWARRHQCGKAGGRHDEGTTPADAKATGYRTVDLIEILGCEKPEQVEEFFHAGPSISWQFLWK